MTSLAVAIVATSPDISAAPVPFSDCPAVFGLADEQEYDTESAVEQFESLSVHGDTFFVTHNGSWAAPEELSASDVELVATETLEDEESVAIFRLTDVPGCSDGLHPAWVDDPLGHGQIMAIRAGVVLAFIQDSLFFLAAPCVDSPNWRMVYRWPYRISRPARGNPSRPTQPKRATKRRRR